MSVIVHSVTKKYRGVTALDGVSCTLSQGVTGLLGPNGAGKTTLLRLLSTALTPTSGTVHVVGHDAHGSLQERTAVRRRLGYLPQEVSFPRGMTTFGFVDYIAVLKEWNDTGTRHREVRRVLDLVDLGALATKKLHALSGGQRRRVALAHALIGAPALLILDEPTTSLDPEQRASLRSVLSGIGHTATVLLATHQTEDVAALCDRVIVIAAGSVRFDGAVQDLVASTRGKVWLCDTEHPGAQVSWRTGTGRYRRVGGSPPPDGELTEPTLEDALPAVARSPRDERDVRYPRGDGMSTKDVTRGFASAAAPRRGRRCPPSRAWRPSGSPATHSSSRVSACSR